MPERREIRPTADRGPILLCVDTSGSMRGPREVVAKALALECMRAAKAQERGCFVFAFAGPQEVCFDPGASQRCRSYLKHRHQAPGVMQRPSSGNLCAHKDLDCPQGRAFVAHTVSCW